VSDKSVKGWRLLKLALTNRKLLIMLIFGFSSGLPYTLLIGTLNAWLGADKIKMTTIGVLSWIGLAYAFKFLWSPLVDQVRLPGLNSLGRRKSWIILCQIILVTAFATLSLINPASNIGWFALLAVIGAFASATQDVAIDAWRIDVADDAAPLELMSTLYQLGYRISGLVGGALALVLAARLNWPVVYGIMAFLIALAAVATFLAPDTDRLSQVGQGDALYEAGEVEFRYRLFALVVVSIGWSWALYEIGSFMVHILSGASDAGGKKASAGDFVKIMGPWIVIATVIIPATVAALMNWAKSARWHVLPDTLEQSDPRIRSIDQVYTALVLPLMELIGRLRWSAFIVLGLILSYQLCTLVWAPFAFPFYLDFLHYSNDQVAFASKIFGVAMTIIGISLGGLLFVWFGRMPTLLIGALLPVGGTLLYSDLAAGGATLDTITSAFGINQLAHWLGSDTRMVRLMAAISMENIATGIAGAAFVAYLSSITSKSFSAVQYALLSSLTFLVGSLGRGLVGEAIDKIGYALVFRNVAFVGFVSVAFVLIEWLRQTRNSQTKDPQ
jgi:PAT family beta-lactamase induction signal transducer AmpG